MTAATTSPAARVEAPDLYERLGLARSADATEIGRAYRALVRQYTPERSPEEFAQIREAYEVLSDPARRQRYDARPAAEVDVIAQAQRAVQARDHETAVRICKQALLAAPDRHDVRALLGFCLLQQGLYDESIVQLERVVASGAATAAVMARLGDAYRAAKRYAEAEGWYRSAMIAGGDEGVGYSAMLADMLVARGELARARVVLESCLSHLSADSSLALKMMAQLVDIAVQDRKRKEIARRLADVRLRATRVFVPRSGRHLSTRWPGVASSCEHATATTGRATRTWRRVGSTCSDCRSVRLRTYRVRTMAGGGLRVAGYAPEARPAPAPATSKRSAGRWIGWVVGLVVLRTWGALAAGDPASSAAPQPMVLAAPLSVADSLTSPEAAADAAPPEALADYRGIIMSDSGSDTARLVIGISDTENVADGTLAISGRAGWIGPVLVGTNRLHIVMLSAIRPDTLQFFGMIRGDTVSGTRRRESGARRGQRGTWLVHHRAGLRLPLAEFVSQRHGRAEQDSTREACPRSATDSITASAACQRQVTDAAGAPPSTSLTAR